MLICLGPELWLGGWRSQMFRIIYHFTAARCNLLSGQRNEKLMHQGLPNILQFYSPSPHSLQLSVINKKSFRAKVFRADINKHSANSKQWRSEYLEYTYGWTDALLCSVQAHKNESFGRCFELRNIKTTTKCFMILNWNLLWQSLRLLLQHQEKEVCEVRAGPMSAVWWGNMAQNWPITNQWATFQLLTVLFPSFWTIL